LIIRKVSAVSRSSVGRLFAFAALAVGATGCTDWAGYDLDYALARAPFIGTMRHTVAIEAQTMPRLPAPGTVAWAAPNGVSIPRFTQAQLDSVAATLTNPLPASAEVIARGEQVYQNVCFVCHGTAGAGNGPVVGAGRFPMGPALNDAVAAARSDGYIYGVMRVGRGLMPAYADRVSDDDRWAVVHYLRRLQGGLAVAAAPAAQ
jgi:mono/diheme cytochrome c family protein